MSVQIMTSVLVITCRREASANLLIEQWTTLETWCGFSVARIKPKRHNRLNIVALVWGGEIQPELVPHWVEEIGIINGQSDLCRAWHQHETTAKQLYQRRPHESENGAIHV